MTRAVIETTSPDATESLAEALGRACVGGEVVLLVGTLGAGKTCFVRGLARGLGLAERVVKSPTYNVMHGYAGGRIPLDHYDAYFVRDVDEFARTGLFEFLADGHVAVIEWADRFVGAFGPDVLEVRLDVVGESTRRLEFVATGAQSRARLASLGLPTTEVKS
ncbi:MAG: tRNA (adenosine(37)-N6)-threonylcarbamoyltransferase complex ATPase subunit type 1 TsaE [Planctomycetes bacterium]|nr:tRNA (adenosine(37)-N6)-threonylcarbamoyltransferase complex ATPase subunit type 1 TsaE [Planctomycetota bacterium]